MKLKDICENCCEKLTEIEIKSRDEAEEKEWWCYECYENENENMNIPNVVTKILYRYKHDLVKDIASSYYRTKSFKINLQKAIKSELEEAIRNQVVGIKDYFFQEFGKHFRENLTTLTEKVIKDNLNYEGKFAEQFEHEMEKYLKEMNFEKTMMEFFNSKKELFMELMMRQMFTGEKK